MEEQLLLLETPLLKVLLLEDETSDWVNPIFDEREKCGELQTVPNAAGASTKIFFSILEWGQTHSGTAYIILIS